MQANLRHDYKQLDDANIYYVITQLLRSPRK